MVEWINRKNDNYNYEFSCPWVSRLNGTCTRPDQKSEPPKKYSVFIIFGLVLNPSQLHYYIYNPTTKVSTENQIANFLDCVGIIFYNDVGKNGRHTLKKYIKEICEILSISLHLTLQEWCSFKLSFKKSLESYFARDWLQRTERE